MIHWPSSNMNSCPPSFMVTGPPSRRRLSTEKAVSSSCDMLGKEPAFRLTGLRGVLNDDLENIGILNPPLSQQFPRQFQVLEHGVFLFVVVKDTALIKRNPRKIALKNGGVRAATMFVGFARLALLSANSRRELGICDCQTRRPHVLVAVRQHGARPGQPSACHVASG